MLYFDPNDESGNPLTAEGLLKPSVLYGEYSESVIAATGAIKPVYGILGMAGVGNTIVFQGLGHDEEVKKRFKGGIHYMTFGRGASLQKPISELAKIMT